MRFEGGLFREEADDIGRSGGCVSCGFYGGVRGGTSLP